MKPTQIAVFGWSLLVTLALPHPGSGDQLFLDPFDYQDGPLLEVAGTPWTAHSQLGNGPVLIEGGRMRLSADGAEDINASLPMGPFDPDGPVAALYAAFTVNVEAPPTAGGAYFAHFRSGNSHRARIWISGSDAPEGMYRLGIANSSGGDASSGPFPLDLNSNTDYRVVVRYDLATGLSSMGIDPESESDLSVTAVDDAGIIGINSVAFRQAAGMGTLRVDDLVVADRFQDLIPIETSRLEVSLAGGELILTWPATPDGYALQTADQLEDSTWSDVTEPVNLADGRNVVRLAPTNGISFFRLIGR
jgi:hypothetical protein